MRQKDFELEKMEMHTLVDLFNARRFSDAEIAAQSLIENNPDNGFLWKILAESKARQGKSALAEFGQALRLLPQDPEVCCSYGTALRNTGNIQGAISCYRLAIQFRPDYAVAHCNLGVAYENLKQYDAAEKAYLDAIRFAPGVARIHNNLGLLYYSQKRLSDARRHYEEAIQLQENLAEAHVGIANISFNLGDTAAARQSYQTALQKNENYPDAELNLAISLLAEGQLREGWKYYEARLETKNSKPQMPANMPWPRWQGEDISGKSILIHHEQGFGDNIQFIRYAALLKQRGAAYVEVFCVEALVPFLETATGIDSIISNRAAAGQHDFWCPIGSLPLHFNTDIASIPCATSYLAVPDAYKEKWRGAISSNRFKVGLVWRGSSGHFNDANRSLPSLRTLAPMWEVEGVEFFSLQKGACEDEAITPPEGQTIVDLGTKIRDFGDTAALVSQLDLIICVDTSIAHLAGALGKQCWVVLPAFCADWRWLLHRSNSPWYPSLRLFRQSRFDDWHGVISEVCQELRLAVGAASI